MKKKKEQMELLKSDSMKRLKRRYAKWKEQQRLEKLLEIDECTISETNELDLENRWQSDFKTNKLA